MSLITPHNATSRQLAPPALSGESIPAVMYPLRARTRAVLAAMQAAAASATQGGALVMAMVAGVLINLNNAGSNSRSKLASTSSGIQSWPQLAT